MHEGEIISPHWLALIDLLKPGGRPDQTRGQSAATLIIELYRSAPVSAGCTHPLTAWSVYQICQVEKAYLKWKISEQYPLKGNGDLGRISILFRSQQLL